MAVTTAGMSGRAISKLGVAWQAAAYASVDGVLTEKMVLDICEEALEDHRLKASYLQFTMYYNIDRHKENGWFNLNLFQMQWLSNEEKYRGMLPYLSQTMDNLQETKEPKTRSDDQKPADNMWYSNKTSANLTNSRPVSSKRLQLKTVRVGNITVAQLMLLYKSKKLSGD